MAYFPCSFLNKLKIDEGVKEIKNKYAKNDDFCYF